MGRRLRTRPSHQTLISDLTNVLLEGWSQPHIPNTPKAFPENLKLLQKCGPASYQTIWIKNSLLLTFICMWRQVSKYFWLYSVHNLMLNGNKGFNTDTHKQGSVHYLYSLRQVTVFTFTGSNCSLRKHSKYFRKISWCFFL